MDDQNNGVNPNGDEQELEGQQGGASEGNTDNGENQEAAGGNNGDNA